MPASRLLPIQEDILALLAGMEPPWTLTGGGALVGFHLGHRQTRDLDLFWHGAIALPAPEAVEERLRAAGYDVAVLRRAPTFVQLRVSDGGDAMVVDLVADPVPVVEPPREARVGGAAILVDTPHEILVNKLCALLSRSALRDLVDVLALLDFGGDLARACRDAVGKDGGFSPATLGWVLHGMPLAALARVSGLGEAETAAVESQRESLASALAALARPPE